MTLQSMKKVATECRIFQETNGPVPISSQMGRQLARCVQCSRNIIFGATNRFIMANNTKAFDFLNGKFLCKIIQNVLVESGLYLLYPVKRFEMTSVVKLRYTNKIELNLKRKGYI